MTSILKKIMGRTAISRKIKRLRGSGKTVAFTNGCFDILHAGHVEYLSKAKDLGDILVVGLNSDSSVRALKGRGRPVNRQKDRARILASLLFVDYVIIFDEATPERLIRSIRPDLLVKGGDWKVENMAGSGFVRSYGGTAKSLPFVKGYSTSSLIKKITKL